VESHAAPSLVGRVQARGEVLQQSIHPRSGSRSPYCRAGAKGAGPAGSQGEAVKSEAEAGGQVQRETGQTFRWQVREQHPSKAQLCETASALWGAPSRGRDADGRVHHALDVILCITANYRARDRSWVLRYRQQV